MRRALYIREFRSALVPNLVTVIAILATLVVVEKLYGLRLGKAEDVRDFTDFALLAGLVVSGFISGEDVSLRMKESRMHFLSSLPISRTWAWLMIVSGRLLAALVSLIIVLLVRHPLSLLLHSGRLLRLHLVPFVALLLFAYSLFFSVGALFALLFRRTLFSYVAGPLALGILSFETILSASYSSELPQLGELSTSPIAFVDGPPLPRVVALLSLLLALVLFLCWRFFVLGEINSPKRPTRNQILLGITAMAFLSFVFCVESSTKLASVRGVWRSDLPAASPYDVSPDGRYLSVFETLQGRPFMCRITILDTGSGRVVGRSVYAGAGWSYWSSHGDVWCASGP
jgi:hypothetical protein